MRLSPHGEEALKRALRDGELRRTFDDKPGQPQWPANANVLAALVRNGLMDRSERRNRKQQAMWVWSITDKGREALEPKPRQLRDRDEYPGVGGGWTTNHARSVDHDPQMGALPGVRVERLDPVWAREALVRHEHDRPTRRRAA